MSDNETQDPFFSWDVDALLRCKCGRSFTFEAWTTAEAMPKFLTIGFTCPACGSEGDAKVDCIVDTAVPQ